MISHSYRPASYSLITIDYGTSNPLSLNVEYEPSNYKASTSTFVDSARNVKGVVTGSVVRNNVSSIELSWNALHTKYWANINARFKKTFYHNVLFYDQVTGARRVAKMYVSDRTAELAKVNSKTGKPEYWKNCSLSLIEV